MTIRPDRPRRSSALTCQIPAAQCVRPTRTPKASARRCAASRRWTGSACRVRGQRRDDVRLPQVVGTGRLILPRSRWFKSLTKAIEVAPQCRSQERSGIGSLELSFDCLVSSCHQPTHGNSPSERTRTQGVFAAHARRVRRRSNAPTCLRRSRRPWRRPARQRGGAPPRRLESVQEQARNPVKGSQLSPTRSHQISAFAQVKCRRRSKIEQFRR
jgi:hypothetical protein